MAILNKHNFYSFLALLSLALNGQIAHASPSDYLLDQMEKCQKDVEKKHLALIRHFYFTGEANAIAWNMGTLDRIISNEAESLKKQTDAHMAQENELIHVFSALAPENEFAPIKKTINDNFAILSKFLDASFQQVMISRQKKRDEAKLGAKQGIGEFLKKQDFMPSNDKTSTLAEQIYHCNQFLLRMENELNSGKEVMNTAVDIIKNRAEKEYDQLQKLQAFRIELALQTEKSTDILRQSTLDILFVLLAHDPTHELRNLVKQTLEAQRDSLQKMIIDAAGLMIQGPKQDATEL